MFVIVAFLIFSGALAAAGYFVWTVPREVERELLAGRLRELRVSGGGSRSRGFGDLIRHEKLGGLAALSRFARWSGGKRR
jgi:hypothetical protein